MSSTARCRQPRRWNCSDEVLDRVIRGLGIPVVVIPGNHDDTRRLSFGAPAAARRRACTSPTRPLGTAWSGCRTRTGRSASSPPATPRRCCLAQAPPRREEARRGPSPTTMPASPGWRRCCTGCATARTGACWSRMPSSPAAAKRERARPRGRRHRPGRRRALRRLPLRRARPPAPAAGAARRPAALRRLAARLFGQRGGAGRSRCSLVEIDAAGARARRGRRRWPRAIGLRLLRGRFADAAGGRRRGPRGLRRHHLTDAHAGAGRAAPRWPRSSRASSACATPPSRASAAARRGAAGAAARAGDCGRSTSSPPSTRRCAARRCRARRGRWWRRRSRPPRRGGLSPSDAAVAPQMEGFGPYAAPAGARFRSARPAPAVPDLRPDRGRQDQPAGRDLLRPVRREQRRGAPGRASAQPARASPTSRPRWRSISSRPAGSWRIDAAARPGTGRSSAATAPRRSA